MLYNIDIQFMATLIICFIIILMVLSLCTVILRFITEIVKHRMYKKNSLYGDMFKWTGVSKKQARLLEYELFVKGYLTKNDVKRIIEGEE